MIERTGFGGVWAFSGQHEERKASDFKNVLVVAVGERVVSKRVKRVRKWDLEIDLFLCVKALFALSPCSVLEGKKGGPGWRNQSVGWKLVLGVFFFF